VAVPNIFNEDDYIVGLFNGAVDDTFKFPTHVRIPEPSIVNVLALVQIMYSIIKL
jgi:hypothetical protein